LSWAPASDNVAVTAYELLRKGGKTVEVFGTSYIVTGLTEATAYDFELHAIDAAGSRSPASTATLRTLDKTPPGPPRSLTASTTQYSVTLNWASASDNVGVVGYQISRSDGGAPVTVAGITYTATQLMDGTEYSFVVSAIDADDNVSRAVPVTVRTQSFRPTGLQLQRTENMWVLFWFPPFSIAVSAYSVSINGTRYLPAVLPLCIIGNDRLTPGSRVIFSVVGHFSTGGTTDPGELIVDVPLTG
jgi:chitodextrinase